MTALTLPDLDIVRTWHLPVRADDSGSDGSLATMEIRFSRFGTWYEVHSWWEGDFIERTVKGAFAKTIKENGPRTKVLFNHGMDFFTGDRMLGLPDELFEDTDSPVLRSNLFDTMYNRDLLPGLRAGAYGSSFMFRVIKDDWNHEPDKSDHNPDGLPERTITEVRLFEAGPVTWPANPEATAGIRCVSGTDAYYESLRTRDPRRVDELRSRVSAHRTSVDPPTAGRPATVGPEAAPVQPNEPAARHSGGPTLRERREALYPYLRVKEKASESGRTPRST